jgi:hypothetical protein
VTTSAPNRQGLKPFSFQTLYGTVETVPYKDFLVAIEALMPVLLNPQQFRGVLAKDGALIGFA